MTLPIKVLKEKSEIFFDNFPNMVVNVLTQFEENGYSLTVSLYLLNARIKHYNYRFLWFAINIENENPFDFEIFAYNNPSETIANIKNEQQFTDALDRLFNLPRTKLILEHIKTIAEISDEYRNKEKFNLLHNNSTLRS